MKNHKKSPNRDARAIN